MKEPTTNILVPKLLDKTSHYANNLKNRIKIDNIFNEFDNSATVNFKKFIKLSEQRYKSVKSGSHLNNIIKSQNGIIKELSENILTNKFYNNDEIEKESKKLLKKMGIKENQDLFELRKDIISKTNNLTKAEIKNREKLLRNAINKRKKNKKILSTLPKNNENYEKNKLSNQERKMTIKYNRKLINFNELNEKKNFFDNLMKNDYSTLNQNFKDYLYHLKDIKLKEHIEGEKKQQIHDKYNYLYNFSPERIKFLSYREDDLYSKKPIKKEEPKIDIIKLMRYTKRGNKKWFQKELKNKGFKPALNSNKKKKQPELKSIFTSTKNTINNNLNRSKLDLDISNSNINNKIYAKTSSNFFNNYKNTIKTVKNEADKSLFMKDNFDLKMKTMEGFFKSKILPKIEDYESLLKNKTNYLINNDISNNNITKSLKKDKFGYDRNSIDNKKEILESYNTAYLNKKIIWEQEDKKRELLKKNNEAEVEEIKNYLKEIKKIGRKLNLYGDPYSKRDDNINNLIKIFNDTLNDEFYSKKKLEYKINEFNNLLEEKEREKKMEEEYINKKIIEEEKKRREQDIQYQIFMKMKQTLEKENERDKNKDENIDFNYKLFLSKGLVSNKVKIDPYQDYKEFFKYKKEKAKEGNCDD